MKFLVTKEKFSETGEVIVTDQKKFADDGLFSKRIFGDMDSKEEYTCECHQLTGKFYENTICSKCGTPVKFVGMNINRYGWIDLSMSKYNQDGVCIEKGENGFHLIQYIAYSQLEKVIGRDILKNIIHIKNTITVNGDIDVEEIKQIQDSDPKNKYWYIGIEGFYEKYNEVLDYYFELNQKKHAQLYEFLKNKDEVFIDKIPVISIILRPAMRTSDGLKLDEINIKYQNILRNIKILQDINVIKLVRDATIEIIQAEFMQLSEEILDAIKSKAGIIRNQICGTRINFSARNIISPSRAGYAIDEVVVPYLTFLELYKFEIINILKNTENISYKAAEREWFNATLGLNEKIYLIMKKMVKENEIGVLLNRNPTISFR